MLVDMAIGDAFGAAFEFVPLERQRELGLDYTRWIYQQHPELPLGNGRYTDDTQMSLAIAEAIVQDRNLSRERLADKFVEVFRRDPRPGYGKRLYEILNRVETGQEFLQAIDPKSTRSGAAMRAGPCGFLRDLKDVLEASALQASVTHDTPEGIMSAQAVSAAVHYSFYDRGPRAELGQFVEEHVPGYAWSESWTDWASVEGIPCAHAALTAVRDGDGLTDVLRRAVAVGGDVDTVAAMAMFIGSVNPEIEDDLPPSLYRGLEDGMYGRSYLQRVDVDLLTAVAF
jgi:ADP-ribosyl-[dinitrogen reductase] hydrolase